MFSLRNKKNTDLLRGIHNFIVLTELLKFGNLFHVLHNTWHSNAVDIFKKSVKFKMQYSISYKF